MTAASLRAGTYRVPGGDFIHLCADATGCLRCEAERSDGIRHEVALALLEDAVLLSEDPAWPYADERFLPSLAQLD